MDCIAHFLDYADTNAFSPIVLDYIRAADTIRPFYEHDVSMDGLRQAIAAREANPVNRDVLVKVLRQQYQGLPAGDAVQRNLALLGREGTFAITTAHQPNIFTGPLYFLYKILHAIRLAAFAKKSFPNKDFVPVYFMGSEDADLQELNHIYAGGETLTWDTRQKGAVGRMSPKGLNVLIRRLEGEFSGLPHGAEMAALIKNAYETHATIQEATLYLVHGLFASFGLIVLIPDHAELKRLFLPLLRRELTEGFSHAAVAPTITALAQHYKVQATGRDINLFYLADGVRNRIERDGAGFNVVDTNLHFTAQEMDAQLEAHPERFSPNVILRGVFQEFILPGIAFIGGGGELAYWLELKGVFKAAQVPYPVLVLRNSFLLVTKEQAAKAMALGIPAGEWFAPEAELVNKLVRRQSEHQLSLEKEIAEMKSLYGKMSAAAALIDATLGPHAGALQTRSLEGIQNLEKKMLRAERRKFDTQKGQIHTLKTALFPNGSLQERVENALPYYAMYGEKFLRTLYSYSEALTPRFCVLTLP